MESSHLSFLKVDGIFLFHEGNNFLMLQGLSRDFEQ